MYVVWKISVLYLSAFGFERLCFPSPPCCASTVPLRVPAAVLRGTQRGRPAARAPRGTQRWIGRCRAGGTAPNQRRWGSCLQLTVSRSERDGGRAYGHAELCSALIFARGQESFL